MNWYSEPECRSSYLRPCRCCLGHMLPLFRLGGAHVGMRARRERRRGGGWEERRRKRGGDGGEQSEEGSGGIVLGRAPLHPARGGLLGTGGTRRSLRRDENELASKVNDHLRPQYPALSPSSLHNSSRQIVRCDRV